MLSALSAALIVFISMYTGLRRDKKLGVEVWKKDA